ncbi:MAG: 2-oxoglutarate oxidoreductase, partial [Bacteroidia bacterium]
MSDNIRREEIIRPENLVYTKTKIMTDNVTSYCPGCGHGTTHRIIAEVIDEMGIQAETIGVA